MPAADDQNSNVPRHIAIIMDGNGRWAKQRSLPRIAGHKAGVSSLKEIVRCCASRNIGVLTVYAFSSENWNRPGSEVSRLMELFMSSLKREVNELNRNNIRLRFIGDLTVFPQKLQDLMQKADSLTRSNTGLQFVVAINYGGRWDITQACRQLVERALAGEVSTATIDENMIARYVALADLPEPDLFIRTGGEMRISNYLLWQLAYTELYFTPCLWPDFSEAEFSRALQWYAGRERRFGRTSEQLHKARHA